MTFKTHFHFCNLTYFQVGLRITYECRTGLILSIRSLLDCEKVGFPYQNLARPEM